MLRSLLCWILSLTLATPAWSLTREQTNAVNEILKASQLTTREVSIQELYSRSGPFIPYDLQREMRQITREFPHLKLPKAKVTKLVEGKQTVVVLEFRRGPKDFANVRITGRQEALQVSGMQNGKKFSYKITAFELHDPVRFLAGIGGGITPMTHEIPSVQFLTVEDVKKLGKKERQEYIDRIRSTLAAAEAAQNSFTGRKTKGAFWSMWLGEAQAQETEGGPSPSAAAIASGPEVTRASSSRAAGPSGACVVAGGLGEYHNGSCSRAEVNGCIPCNPDVYGQNAYCVPSQNGHTDIAATQKCNDATKDSKYAVFQGVPMTSQADVEARKNALKATIDDLNQKCAEIKQGVASGTKLSDQVSACENLQTRLTELSNVQCGILAQDASRFKDLKCNPGGAGGATVAVQCPLPAATADSGRNSAPSAPPELCQGSAQAPAVGGASSNGTTEECSGLPANEGELKCNGSGKSGSVTCPIDGSHAPRYYCNCSGGEDPIRGNCGKAVECRVARDAPAPSHSSTREHERAEKSWWTKSWPWLLGLAVGGAGLWAMYQSGKSQIKSQVALYTPTTVQTPVPPPSTSTSTTLGTTGTVISPVDTTRSSPTGTR